MRVTTGGRSAHGRDGFVLEHDPQAVVQPDIEWLARLLDETAASDVRYRLQETLRVGWVDLIVGEADGGYMTLLEPDVRRASPNPPRRARSLLDLNDAMGGKGVAYAVSSQAARTHFEGLFRRYFPDQPIKVWHVPGAGM